MNVNLIVKSFLTLALAVNTNYAWAEDNELNPNITEVKPGDTVKVSRIPGTIYLRTQNDPDDLIWDRLPMYHTNLLTAPPVHQSVKLRFDEGATLSKRIYFQVAQSSERFYIRLRWKDATQDRTTTVDAFRDGVAVQFAINNADTSYMMGSGPKNPVNIWYWRADTDKVADLAAGGFGSTTTLPVQAVSGASSYILDQIPEDNAWHVVMSRPLKVNGKYDVNFQRPIVPMGFAVWQGSDEERDGNKRVTHTWIKLDTGYTTASVSKK